MTVSQSRARRRLAAAFAICAAGLHAGMAGAQSTSDSDRKAYDVTIRCFYADMYVVSAAQEKGEADKAAAYEASAHRSFDGAKRLGQQLGLSPEQIDSDFDSYQTNYAAKLVHDSAYFAGEAALCKRLGLM